jgi:tetratricopeptide (TPR) repeat protein
MKSAHYAAAAESYKIALKYEPESEELWEKHRQAFQMGRAIDGYVAKAEALLDKGLHEEAASFLKLAVRLSPRNMTLWRLYERALAENPHVVVVTTEQEAWDAYRRGREVLDGGRPGAAIRYFEPVIAFTSDERLKFYAERLLAKAEETVRKDYPNLPSRITDR